MESHHVLIAQKVLNPLSGVRVSALFAQEHQGLYGPLREEVANVRSGFVSGYYIIMIGAIWQSEQRRRRCSAAFWLVA